MALIYVGLLVKQGSSNFIVSCNILFQLVFMQRYIAAPKHNVSYLLKYNTFTEY